MNNRNYGNHSRRKARQAIDGILNVPARSSQSLDPLGAHEKIRPNFKERLRRPAGSNRRYLATDMRRPRSIRRSEADLLRLKTASTVSRPPVHAGDDRPRVHAPIVGSNAVHKPTRLTRNHALSRTRRPLEHRPASLSTTTPVNPAVIAAEPKRHAPAHHDAPLHQATTAHVSAHTPTRTRARKRFAKPHRAQRSQKANWKSWVLRGSVAACVLLIVGVGIFGYINFSKIFQGGGASAALNEDVDPSKLRGEGDGRVNILLLGRGGEGHDGPDLTDTLLVASVDPVNKKMAFVSVPRDLWVEGKYSESKINAVFAGAKNAALADGDSIEEAEKIGVSATEKVIQEVLGINIHYYSMIDFAGFERAVNTVGGVTINAPEQLRDPTMAWENNWNPIIVNEGVQELDGKRALMYARSRYTSENGDFDRAERQRILLTALKNEVTSTNTYTNPLKVSQLVADFADNAKTDFGLNDIMRLQEILRDIKTIDSIGLTDTEDTDKNFLTTDNYGGQSVVVPVAGTFSYDAIRLFIRSSLPDGYITRENAPIRIMNGTSTIGAAQQKSDELKSYKYNVQAIENAPTQNYDKTVLVDLTGDNKYTLHYLERRLGVKATTDIPEGITLTDEQREGFIIIIGRNEATTR